MKIVKSERRQHAIDFYSVVKGEGSITGMPRHWLAVIEAENARNARIAAANETPANYDENGNWTILWA